MNRLLSASLRHLVVTLAIITLAALASVIDAAAQTKRALDHEDVENWNRISGNALSRDGSWLVWEVGPEEKDGMLRFKSISSSTEYSIERGDNALFSPDSRFAAFKIVPATDSVRTAKLEKKKDDDMPKDSLGILNLETGVIEGFERVQSFKFPEKGGNRIAYKLLKSESKSDSTDVDEEVEEPESSEPEPESEEAEDEDEKKDKAEGTTLVVRNLDTGAEARFNDVTDYEFSEDGQWLAFIRSNKEGDVDGVYILEAGATEPTEMMMGEGEYKKIAMDEHSSRVAFLSNRDDYEADQPAFTLYRASLGSDTAEAVASAETEGMRAGWWVSEHGNVYFSKSGVHLYFGTAPRPDPEPDDDDILEEEKVELDIWSWTDPLLQPMQLLQADDERDRSYLAVLRDGSDSLVQLATEIIPNVTVALDGDGAVALGTSNLLYRQEISWDSPRYYDAWQIDASSGRSEQFLVKVQDTPRLSPEGKYVYWWDRNDLVWRARSTESGEGAMISSRIPFPVDNQLHDSPSRPRSYGVAGWTKGDARILFYDEFDIWAVEVHGDSAPQNITEGVGRDQKIRFRLIDLDPDEDFIDPDATLLLSAFNTGTKDAGFYSDQVSSRDEPSKIVMSDHVYGFPRKADEAEVFSFTRQNFVEFPDLWTGGAGLSNRKKMSDANPQQANFSWGTPELYYWTSLDGEELTGILYKPDGFNASEKYPMMVYFYERNSDNLNRHRAPGAGGSSINHSFYVSRGYLLFVPDIPYKVGYPGESAMNSVMPGVTSLISEGFVDAKHIGVQGHSWGGYQIAYMITQTNLFAAAEAGAPVVNMTSAYGGIRWGSGMSRMFQYEMTQSRIGGTLWNATLRYIHNSPLFQADKVETPVLMMHNDKDGAVPWYQGIEYFVALRRLGKPAWLINYNNEAHGLRKYKNRKDWTIRLQQFFDHYLKDEPAPVWLKGGVPAVDKGRTLGLDLIPESVESGTDH